MTDPVSIPPRMTQAAYARWRGVSRQAIYDLVQRGKIELVDAAGNPWAEGEKFIDVAAADFALGETRERIGAADDELPAGDAVDELIDAPDAAQPLGETPAPAVPSATAKLTQAKTDTEIYRAKTAELQYLKLCGELVEVDAVAAAAAECGEQVLLLIRQLSGRADALTSAAANGLPGVRGVLKTIERDLLAGVAEAFNKLAAEAAAGKADEISSEAAE